MVHRKWILTKLKNKIPWLPRTDPPDKQINKLRMTNWSDRGLMNATSWLKTNLYLMSDTLTRSLSQSTECVTLVSIQRTNSIKIILNNYWRSYEGKKSVTQRIQDKQTHIHSNAKPIKYTDTHTPKLRTVSKIHTNPLGACWPADWEGFVGRHATVSWKPLHLLSAVFVQWLGGEEEGDSLCA